MPVLSIKFKLEQDVADTDKVITIDTGLGVKDQKTVWELVAIDVHWANAEFIQQKNHKVSGILTRKIDKLSFLDGEVIGAVRWGVYNGGNSGGAVQLESVIRHEFIERPWVANSHIYFGVVTVNTILKNQLEARLYYEEKKVSELEFIKAQSGYCVC